MRAHRDLTAELDRYAPELKRSFLIPGAPQEGQLREREEDFVVEELPLYEASGEGDHHYLSKAKIVRLCLTALKIVSQ